MSWDNFWEQGNQSTFVGQGPQQKILTNFWHIAFDELSKTKSAVILEVGCGTQSITKQLASKSYNFEYLIGADVSHSAIKQFAGDTDQSGGVQCKAQYLPIKTSSVDMVISQFGLEYGGMQAFEEAVRSLKLQGKMKLVSHKVGSDLYKDSVRDLKALENIFELELFDLSSQVIQVWSGYKLSRNSMEKVKNCNRQLLNALNKFQLAVTNDGDAVAAGIPKRLLLDLHQVFSRLPHHDVNQLSQWLSINRENCQAYMSRLKAMKTAALDDDQLNEIKSKLLTKGYGRLAWKAIEEGAKELGWNIEFTKGNFDGR